MIRWRHIAIIFTGLFLLMQGMASAHVAEFGLDHEHDGVACSVAVFADDQADMLDNIPVSDTDFVEAPEIPRAVRIIDATVMPCPARAPPPRGPPALTS